MTSQPQYFEPIREAAARRWDQLERDPDLAGPWHQLFKQVQSPRHVLSELLQNADDAGATEASVRIEDAQFLFTHNGDDFIEEHFTSLCRFGYSNKRALHTIGFRGIGFKSTFSLGDTVELFTPTVSVAFHRQRFTEPRWVPSPPRNSGLTQVRVVIGDPRRKQAIEENLQDWLKSPVSLLFFKHIRRMRIADREVHWKSLGPGPVQETERMALSDNPAEEFVIARSPAEPFPDDALAEIRQERLLGIDQETEFPACRVEIVLGAKGRLYVVLPTGVTTALPFACNAPFIQDPARLKIRDLAESPTNRWLLERVGKLAATVMLQWLGKENASVAERSRAYGLFPDVDGADQCLEGASATIVEQAFGETISGQPFLLTNAGELKPAKESVILPGHLLDVWPGEQITALLDNRNRPAFSRYVSVNDREKLIHWDTIEQIGKSDVLNVLQTKHLPKPDSWPRLLKLWAYIAPEVTGYRFPLNKANLRIVPVQGKDVLYAANQVARLGEKRLLQSEEDWEFLAAHLLVLNQNWPRFLAEQRRAVEEQSSEAGREEVEAAFAVLAAIGLGDASDVSKVVEQVAAEFFTQKSLKLADCVQLAQIAAKLGATVGTAFRFVTHDRQLRATSSVVLYDQDGAIEELFPENWCAAHLLHQEYGKSFTSCTSEEWHRWISSGRAGLPEFVPLTHKRPTLYGRHKIEAEVRRRGFGGTLAYPYKTSSFVIEDWDFEESHWHHWATLLNQDPNIWGSVVECILAQPDNFWSKAKSARVLHVATTGSTQAIVHELPPTWILRLRELPCLPDTRGFYHKPAELLLRSPETEPFMDVEPFVHGRLDREAVRPLLTLLGVRATPTGPDRLLDCLRALAKAQRPPVHEVEKWYRRLDQMMDTCSTADLADIKKAFREEKIVLTDGGGWTTVSGVFLSSDEEDVPGAEIVRASVRDLALWRKLNIADRPTVELAILWLKQLQSGASLSPDDSRRVRALLARHAARIWDECGHWLNLAGEWVPVQTLSYALTMQTLVPWSHLHEAVKQKAADLQRLSVEVTEAPPFSNLPHLASNIEERFHRNPLLSQRAVRRPWLNQLGLELQRIELDDPAETVHVRVRANELAETFWQTTPGLEIIPYIDGVPAGTPRRAEVLWLDKVLYIEDRPLAKLARVVSQELGRAFRRQDIADAIKFCFERFPEFVTEYLEENFRLLPREAVDYTDDEPAETATVHTHSDSETAEPPRAEDVLRGEELSAPTSEAPEQFANHDNSTGPEDTAEDEVEAPIGEDTPQKTQCPAKPATPGIMERFAHAQGFRKDGQDRFCHSDGSWIWKPAGERFWERRNGHGELVRNYWPKDHCLEQQPLQIEADLWGLIDKFPDMYALVLSNAQNEAVEITGSGLRAMRDGGELKLYPATYRLVYSNDSE